MDLNDFYVKYHTDHIRSEVLQTNIKAFIFKKNTPSLLSGLCCAITFSITGRTYFKDRIKPHQTSLGAYDTNINYVVPMITEEEYREILNSYYYRACTRIHCNIIGDFNVTDKICIELYHDFLDKIKQSESIIQVDSYVETTFSCLLNEYKIGVFNEYTILDDFSGANTYLNVTCHNYCEFINNLVEDKSIPIVVDITNVINIGIEETVVNIAISRDDNVDITHEYYTHSSSYLFPYHHIYMLGDNYTDEPPGYRLIKQDNPRFYFEETDNSVDIFFNCTEDDFKDNILINYEGISELSFEQSSKPIIVHPIIKCKSAFLESFRPMFVFGKSTYDGTTYVNIVDTSEFLCTETILYHEWMAKLIDEHRICYTSIRQIRKEGTYNRCEPPVKYYLLDDCPELIKTYKGLLEKDDIYVCDIINTTIAVTKNHVIVFASIGDNYIDNQKLTHKQRVLESNGKLNDTILVDNFRIFRPSESEMDNRPSFLNDRKTIIYYCLSHNYINDKKVMDIARCITQAPEEAFVIPKYNMEVGDDYPHFRKYSYENIFFIDIYSRNNKQTIIETAEASYVKFSYAIGHDYQSVLDDLKTKKCISVYTDRDRDHIAHQVFLNLVSVGDEIYTEGLCEEILVDSKSYHNSTEPTVYICCEAGYDYIPDVAYTENGTESKEPYKYSVEYGDGTIYIYFNGDCSKLKDKDYTFSYPNPNNYKVVN